MERVHHLGAVDRDVRDAPALLVDREFVADDGIFPHVTTLGAFSEARGPDRRRQPRQCARSVHVRGTAACRVAGDDQARARLRLVQVAGLNFGTTTSSETRSNTTSSGIPITSSSASAPTML